MVKSVRCLTCNGIVEHNPRQITGCFCDPDAPHWVYIDRDGNVKGWSQARWELIDAAQTYPSEVE